MRWSFHPVHHAFCASFFYCHFFPLPPPPPRVHFCSYFVSFFQARSLDLPSIDCVNLKNPHHGNYYNWRKRKRNGGEGRDGISYRPALVREGKLRTIFIMHTAIVVLHRGAGIKMLIICMKYHYRTKLPTLFLLSSVYAWT